MSFQATASAIEAPITPKLKLTLLTLANYADEHGYCYPSYQTLAEQTGFNRRTIISHVKQLIEIGVLEKALRYTKKGNTSNMFLLKIGEYMIRLGYIAKANAQGFIKWIKEVKQATSPTKSRGENINTPPVIADHPPSDQLPPDPIKDPINDPIKIPPNPPEGEPCVKTESQKFFDQVWAVWQNKGDKKRAIRAFTKYLKANKGNEQQAVNYLLVDIKNRKMYQQIGFDKLHLSTYINNNRFADPMPMSS